jgi:CheY-like chemotaxis protein
VARVLIVEDERTLLNSIVRGLSKLPDVEVVGATTLGEALARIDEAPPQLIFSDIDLPDRSGLELIGELGRRGLRCKLTFVSAYTKAFAAQIPRHAKVRVIEKPVSLERLRELVREGLGEQLTTRDEITPFGVADYLQIACLGQHSVIITVGAEASPMGVLVVYGGTLWSARDSQGDGGGAVMRLALVRGQRVAVRSMTGDPGPRDVHEGWEALLIEAARRADERARDSMTGIRAEDGFGKTLERMPGTDEFFISELPPPPSEQMEPEAAQALGAPPPAEEPPKDLEVLAFETALDTAIQALLAKRYREAWNALREAERLRPDDRTVQANLQRLRQLGIDDEPPKET